MTNCFNESTKLAIYMKKKIINLGLVLDLFYPKQHILTKS